MKNIQINSRTIGDGQPCYVVGEIGGLYKTFDEAKRLIDSAIEIGLDAVKIQTFEAETITSKNNDFHLGVTGNVSQYEFFKQMEVSKELQKQVVDYANKKGITIFSTPSHMEDLKLMVEMNPPAFKIGSDLACHLPLLKKIASFGKPIILSTGMCTLDEVKTSVDAIRSQGNDQIVLLHCVSDYPAKIEESNFLSIQTMKNEFKIPVGFSDHSIGSLGILTASTLGANMIEKHFRHPENDSHADDVHALTPLEFKEIIDSIRKIEKSLGNGIKTPTVSELKNLENNRVSIITAKEIPLGTIITPHHLDVKRPGTGIHPFEFDKVVGKKSIFKIKADVPIKWNMLE